MYVVLDPDCRLGHHVFADSANNGPYGKALIEELIPHIEKTLPRRRQAERPGSSPAIRPAAGAACGCRSTYPDFFGGVWSTGARPGRFPRLSAASTSTRRAEHVHRRAGQAAARSPARASRLVLLQAFSDMEVVIGRGGQLFSFEAVFSPAARTASRAAVGPRDRRRSIPRSPRPGSATTSA